MGYTLQKNTLGEYFTKIIQKFFENLKEHVLILIIFQHLA